MEGEKLRQGTSSAHSTRCQVRSLHIYSLLVNPSCVKEVTVQLSNHKPVLDI